MQSQPANLPAGFKNNFVPQNVPSPMNIPPNIDQAIMQMPSMDSDTINILGQVLPKKYFYLFLVFVLAAVGYFLWKWYNKKSKDSDDEDDENDDGNENDDDDSQMMPVYPSGQLDPQQHQMLMNQLLQQQQMMQDNNK